MTINWEKKNVPAIQKQVDEEVARMLEGLASSHSALMKFNNGHYFIGKIEVPCSTKFWAFCRNWRRGWRFWRDNKVVTDLMVRVADDPRAPVDRDKLDELDKTKWPLNNDGKPSDPWVCEHQLPLENVESGERALFTSSSYGGKIAIEILCRRFAREIGRGLPVVKLEVGEFSTKKYPHIARPDFPIIGWEHDGNAGSGGNKVIDVTPPMSGEEPPWPDDNDFR